jgi:hypothetical protein
MRRFIRLIREILKSIVNDVRADFEVPDTYIPYEPKVLGNKLKGDSDNV